MSENMITLLAFSATVTGGSAITYWLGCKVDDWWQSRKAHKAWLEHAEASRMQAEAEYISEITAENERMRDCIAQNLSRELSWIDERKRLIARANFMAQELTYDDSKKTQVIEPWQKAK